MHTLHARDSAIDKGVGGQAFQRIHGNLFYRQLEGGFALAPELAQQVALGNYSARAVFLRKAN
jgi:hypothetical protein